MKQNSEICTVITWFIFVARISKNVCRSSVNCAAEDSTVKYQVPSVSSGKGIATVKQTWNQVSEVNKRFLGTIFNVRVGKG